MVFLPSPASSFPSQYQGNGFQQSSSPFVHAWLLATGSQSTSSTKNQGSRVASYSATPEIFQSISAMPNYKRKSHEELRFEDYGLGDKGGQVHCGFPFHTPPLSNQSSVSPFQPFKSTFSELERGNSVTPSNTISTAPTISPVVNPFPLRPVTDFFWPTFTSNWNPSSLIPSTEPMHTKSFEFPKTFPSSSVGTFPFTKPSLAFSPSIQSTTVTSSDSLPSLVAPSKSFEFLKTCPSSCPSSSIGTFSFTKPSVTFSPSIQSTPVTSSDSLPSTVSPSKSFEFLKTFPSSSVVTFPFTKPSVTFSPSIQSTPVTSSDSWPSIVAPSHPQQKTNEQFAPPSNLTMQSPLVVNPFATRLPVDQPNALTSRLHGISSLPVSDNLSPNRRESLLRILHASSSLPGLPTRKPNGGKTKVPFFIDEEDKLGSVAPFMPKENPRGSVNVSSLSLHSPQDSKDEEVKKSSCSFQLDENSTRSTDETASQHDEASASTGRYVADVLTLLPKLQAADYYTKPSLLELAAMETAEAGFCSHVKDFVVGRKGYGSIKFIGETDVRHLDIESIVQFKDREVTVYPDEEKKPRVGQQLNKEAEVTLLNVKCIDSKTGKQYVEGHQVQSYQETLIKKIEEQGAEFVSYDPVEGEWKVRVQHF